MVEGMSDEAQALFLILTPYDRRTDRGPVLYGLVDNGEKAERYVTALGASGAWSPMAVKMGVNVVNDMAKRALEQHERYSGEEPDEGEAGSKRGISAQQANSDFFDD